MNAILILFLFLSTTTLQATENTSINSETEETQSASIDEAYSWFLKHGNLLAQWMIVFILGISAVMIYLQIKAQNMTKMGENFLKLADYINAEEHQQNIDIISAESKKNPDSIKKPDSELTPELRRAVSRVRYNYHLIGIMISSNMVSWLQFIKLHSREGRDIWNMLEENVNKTNEERNIPGKMGEEYFRGFRLVGEMCSFWHQLSDTEKWMVLFGWFSIMPGSPYFLIRTSIMNLINRMKSMHVGR